MIPKFSESNFKMTDEQKLEEIKKKEEILK